MTKTQFFDAFGLDDAGREEQEALITEAAQNPLISGWFIIKCVDNGRMIIRAYNDIEKIPAGRFDLGGELPCENVGIMTRDEFNTTF